MTDTAIIVSPARAAVVSAAAGRRRRRRGAAMRCSAAPAWKSRCRPDSVATSLSPRCHRAVIAL